MTSSPCTAGTSTTTAATSTRESSDGLGSWEFGFLVIESRPDVDSSRLAYYGLSMGANYGPVVGAVGARFRTLVLVSGGMSKGRLRGRSAGFRGSRGDAAIPLSR